MLDATEVTATKLLEQAQLFTEAAKLLQNGNHRKPASVVDIFGSPRRHVSAETRRKMSISQKARHAARREAEEKKAAKKAA